MYGDVRCSFINLVRKGDRLYDSKQEFDVEMSEINLYSIYFRLNKFLFSFHRNCIFFKLK